MVKNILLILGHPSKNSFNRALLDAYQTGAESTGGICKTIYISDLSFDINLADGYKTGKADQLEEDLVSAQRLFQWADHVVMAFPNWWGAMPAVTKGFIDRVFLPGFAFKNHSGKAFPEKLLKGKSMRVLVTMDTPKFWFYLIHRASLYLILKKVVFGYVGFDPIGFSTFGFMRRSTDGQRNNWLRKVEQLGRSSNKNITSIKNNKMKKLKDKIAIVTGANQGIGFDIAKKIAQHGAIVYAFDIKEDADYGESIFFIKTDVADEGNWRTSIQQVLKEQGRIDILVNNAGIIAYTPIHEIELEEWNRLIAVDQTGVLLGMKHVLPSMLKQRCGAIINVSSIWAKVGAANVVAYNAAKGAVGLMTKNAAITYAKNGIRVNAVNPGFINTPLTGSQDAALNKIVIDATPMGRAGEPVEIANGVVFLASDEASYITGAELVIDGGYTAQ